MRCFGFVFVTITIWTTLAFASEPLIIGKWQTQRYNGQTTYTLTLDIKEKYTTFFLECASTNKTNKTSEASATDIEPKLFHILEEVTAEDDGCRLTYMPVSLPYKVNESSLSLEFPFGQTLELMRVR